ncbi:MAG: TMEM43 family protein [Cyclobacteriaceae bacterium]|nr:hypothetical protein [Cyclobacteriaceae bacterium]MCH8515514.1 TMEM43 family protein [Cyclobacteriaceae bacterium]
MESKLPTWKYILIAIFQAPIRIALGLLILSTTFYLSNCTENHGTSNYRWLRMYESEVIELEQAEIQAENEGKLIFIKGLLRGVKPLRDNEFSFEIEAAAYHRKVEMYQWNAFKRDERTIYRADWYEYIINSELFKDDRQNPKSIPFESKSEWTDTVMLGEFHLGYNFPTVPINDKLYLIPESVQLPQGYTKNGHYILSKDANPDDPKVGDVRISYRYTQNEIASALGGQQNNLLMSYKNPEMSIPIRGIMLGEHNPEDLMQRNLSDNTALLWMARLGLIIPLYIGLRIFLRAFLPYNDKIPIFRFYLQAGFWPFTALLSWIAYLLFIFYKWVNVATVIPNALLAWALALMMLLHFLAKKSGKTRTI